MSSQQYGLEASEASVHQALSIGTTEKQRVKDLGQRIINLGRERDGLVVPRNDLIAHSKGWSRRPER